MNRGDGRDGELLGTKVGANSDDVDEEELPLDVVAIPATSVDVVSDGGVGVGLLEEVLGVDAGLLDDALDVDARDCIEDVLDVSTGEADVDEVVGVGIGEADVEVKVGCGGTWLVVSTLGVGTGAEFCVAGVGTLVLAGSVVMSG